MTLDAAPTLVALNQGVDSSRLERFQAQARRATLGDAASFPMPQIAPVGRMYRGRDGVRERPKGRTPLLLVAGTLDGTTPVPTMLKATRGLKPNRTVLLVKNGGHDIFFDHPDVVPSIRSFLARQEVASVTVLAQPPAISARPGSTAAPG